MKTLEIIYAEKALGLLNNTLLSDEKFIHFLDGLPTKFVQCGLLQTISFLKANSDSNKKELGSQFESFLSTDIRHLAIMEQKQYVSNQKRAIALSVKLKQIANALYQERGTT